MARCVYIYSSLHFLQNTSVKKGNAIGTFCPNDLSLVCYEVCNNIHKFFGGWKWESSYVWCPGVLKWHWTLFLKGNPMVTKVHLYFHCQIKTRKCTASELQKWTKWTKMNSKTDLCCSDMVWGSLWWKNMCESTQRGDSSEGWWSM